MPPFHDIDLDRLLKAPEWTDAHDCFQLASSSRRNRPYGELYGQDAVLPLWLYARTCLEEELEAERARRDRNIRNRGDDSTYSTSPANRLPRALLARIFLHLRDLFLNTTTRSEDSPDWRTRRKTLGLYSWLYVTLVCRRWRDTTYTCPRLWTWIGLSEGCDRELVRSLLILSGEEPLRVFWDTSASAEKTVTTRTIGNEDEISADNIGVKQIGEVEIKLELIMDERARVEELEFSLETTTLVRLVPWKEFVSYPWTRLIRLVLRGPGHASENFTCIPSSIKKGKIMQEKKELRVLPALKEENFPRLRELILDGLVLRWDETHLPELIRLEIRNIDPRKACSSSGDEAGVSNDSLEAVEFDLFLLRCTQLRTLKFLDFPSYDMIPTSTCSKDARLQRDDDATKREV
ncbi:hypothetical protein ACEPAI_8941 [Sanghuangporus weigelae]